MEGNCIQFNIVYKAEVCEEGETKGQGKLYVGLASGEWKLCYNNHTKSFRERKCVGDSELGKHVWHLKDKGIKFKIHWEKLLNATPYTK